MDDAGRPCLWTAAQMLGLDSSSLLPSDLRRMLLRADDLVARVKPGGHLRSTQAIASIIVCHEGIDNE